MSKIHGNGIIFKISNLVHVYANIMLKFYVNFHTTAEPTTVALPGIYCFHATTEL